MANFLIRSATSRSGSQVNPQKFCAKNCEQEILQMSSVPVETGFLSTYAMHLVTRVA